MASELNQAISPPMDLTLYKSMAGCKISRCSIQPENRVELGLTSGSTSDLYFAINSRPNSFINGTNSYMSFTYSMNGTAATVGAKVSLANGSPSSLIRTLEILAGSTSLELISSYNVVAAIVEDFAGADRSKTMGTILSDKSATDIKTGFARDIGASAAVGTTDGFTQDRRVCLSLLSSTIGSLAERYFPVGKDCGLRVRMTMEDPNVCLVATDATPVPPAVSAATGVLGYTLKDITLEIEYIEVPPQIYNGIASESGNVFKVCGTGISSYATTIGAGGAAQSILIPARYSSVRNLFTSVRRQDYTNNKYCNSVGARCRDYISSYVYRVSGVNYPQLPVSVDNFTGAEVFTELSKCWAAHAALDLNVVFNSAQFVDCAPAANQIVAFAARQSCQTQGSFLMGITFEEAGFSSSQMSGISTVGGNVFLDVSYAFPAGVAACQATIFDTFCFYDNIIEINHVTGEVSVSR